MRSLRTIPLVLLIMISSSMAVQSSFPGTEPIVFGAVNSGSIYYRPFNLIYANQGGPNLKEDAGTIISAFNSFHLKPTLFMPVLLNRDPALEDSFIQQLKTIAPNLCFAMGKPDWVNLQDSNVHSTLIGLATKFAAYTNCIEVDHFNEIAKQSGDAATTDFLTELHKMGFQHIVSNPWTESQSGKPWVYIEAAEIAIDSSSWQPKYDRISQILLNSPNIVIVANYENPPAQVALASLGAASIHALSVAADGQNSSSVPYRWYPPWSSNYDPYSLGTLSWIVNTMASVDPQPQTTTTLQTTRTSQNTTSQTTTTSQNTTASTQSSSLTATSWTASTKSITSKEKKRTTTSVGPPPPSSVIPGFPWEAILAGLLLGIAALAQRRRRKINT